MAASTQNQALAALLFLYKEVLGIELPWLNDVTRAKRPKRLPTVLTRGEVQSLFAHLEGTHALIARLLYGTGMRLMEVVRRRVKDVDFERREILVRDGKRASLAVVLAVAEPQALLARVPGVQGSWSQVSHRPSDKI